MRAKRFLTVSTAILVIFAFSTAQAVDSDCGCKGKSTQANFMDTVDSGFNVITGVFGALLGFADDAAGGAIDRLPRMQSAPPETESEIVYDYVPRHTSGNPKWRPRRVK